MLFKDFCLGLRLREWDLRVIIRVYGLGLWDRFGFTSGFRSGLGFRGQLRCRSRYGIRLGCRAVLGVVGLKATVF